jgi:hypothetical protein
LTILYLFYLHVVFWPHSVEIISYIYNNASRDIDIFSKLWFIFWDETLPVNTTKFIVEYEKRYLMRNEYCTHSIKIIIQHHIVIIANIAESQLEQAVILVIMYVETFKTDVVVFISNVIMGFTSNWPIIFSVRVSQLSISFSEIKGKMYRWKRLSS